MTAHLLTIGDEILIGQIVDTNSAWMSQQLNLRGIRVTGKSSVGDEKNEIIAGIEHALSLADVVIVTGGLGPTKDDITKSTLAEMFGANMVFHEETYQRLEAYFQKINKPLGHWAVPQSTLPDNCLVLPNKVGAAPGMWFERAGKVLVSLPGVPFEMEYLMSAEVLPRLSARFQSRPIAHRTLLTAGEGESNIARRLEGFENALPGNIKLAYLPDLGKVRLRLTGVWPGEVSESSEAELNKILDEKSTELAALLQDLVFGTGETNLQTAVGEILRQQNKKFGTAESCTGGYVAHLITSVAGASDYFPGTVVSYSNEIKERMLGVRAETLRDFGAVSPETVREMAAGALDLLGVDVALAVSGIAGPGGGTSEKPVGLVWMAVADRTRTVVERHNFARDRGKNIQLSATYGLNLVRKFLMGKA